MYQPAPALHMLSFENFVKSMPPSLSELKVTPTFCFAFKIPDNPTATKLHICAQQLSRQFSLTHMYVQVHSMYTYYGSMNYLLLETNFCSLCTVLDLIINGCCNICCFKFLLHTTKKHQRRHVGFIKNNKNGWTVVMWLIKTNDN